MCDHKWKIEWYSCAASWCHGERHFVYVCERCTEEVDEIWNDARFAFLERQLGLVALSKNGEEEA